jgi:hypothetical protein
MYRLDMGNGQTYPVNYVYNKSSCSPIGCGQIFVNSNYSVYDHDLIGSYHSGIVAPGNVPVPYDGSKTWTVHPDPEGDGALVTVLAQGAASASASHTYFPVTVWPCPSTGCISPPPIKTSKNLNVSKWSDPSTWEGTQLLSANPLHYSTSIYMQNWSSLVPGDGDNVWIPSWKTVRTAFDKKTIFLLSHRGIVSKRWFGRLS